MTNQDIYTVKLDGKIGVICIGKQQVVDFILNEFNLDIEQLDLLNKFNQGKYHVDLMAANTKCGITFSTQITLTETNKLLIWD